MESSSHKNPHILITDPPIVNCPVDGTDVVIEVPAGSHPHFRLTFIQSATGYCQVNSGGKAKVGPAVVLAHYLRLPGGTTETLRAIDSDGETMTFHALDEGVGESGHTSFVRVRAENGKGDEVEITVVMQDTTVPRVRTKRRAKMADESTEVEA